MNCPRCGNDNADEYSYCLFCGTRLDSEATIVKPSFSPTLPIPKDSPLQVKDNKKGRERIWLSLAVCVAIIVAAIFAALYFHSVEENKRTNIQKTYSSPISSQPRATYTPSPVTSAPPSPPKPASSDLVAWSNMTVKPLDFISIKFTILPSNYQGVVVGKYEAWGGKNDINVMLLDAREFSSFKNLGSYSYYYNPGYIHAPAQTIAPEGRNIGSPGHQPWVKMRD